MNVDFSKIKLVIWDLDETFWHGTLSEGNIVIPNEHIELLKNLIDAGVVCSICSKNECSDVEVVLKENNIFDLFVFNSINWSPKGERIRQIINEMNLRSVNVLFIDDNSTNRQEASSFCSGVMISDIDIIPEMISYYTEAEKKDIEHKRLEQYKVLEKKVEFKAKAANNEDFLYSCHICVKICDDCLNQLSRISELVLRTNQLNFTKIRSTEDELKAIICDKEYYCGYVCVNDDFGDYGIVGFFAVKNNRAVHFLFSCRTLNMGIEQYVYNVLGKPDVQIVPEVSSDLDIECPKWINQKEIIKKEKKKKRKKLNSKILIKGPCDMEQMFSFIEPSNNIITEFTYINDKGVSIEHYNHTTQIINSLILNESDKQRIISLPFCDEKMYSTSIWNEDVEVVMLSLFNDPHLGIYKEKSSGILMSFGEYLVDMTNADNWDKIISKQFFTANHSFTLDELQSFKNNFEYLGRLSPEQVLENLKFILSKMNDNSILVLCLGSEINIDESEYVNHESYIDRHIYNKELNRLVRQWAESENRVQFIDVNDYVHSRDDFLDTINHMVKPIYQKMSIDFIKIVEQKSMLISSKKSPSTFDDFIMHVKRRIRFILYNER